MTINERMSMIVSNLKMNVNSFSTKINVHPTVIHNILKGRNNPSYEVLTKILSTFDNINTEWLLIGNGEMFKNQQNQAITADSTPIDASTPSEQILSNDNILKNRSQLDNQKELDFLRRELESRERELASKEKIIQLLELQLSLYLKNN